MDRPSVRPVVSIGELLPELQCSLHLGRPPRLPPIGRPPLSDGEEFDTPRGGQAEEPVETESPSVESQISAQSPILQDAETVETGSPTVGSQISAKSPILQEGNQIGGSCSDSFSASPAVRKTSEVERSKTSLSGQRWRRAGGGLKSVPSATSVEGSGCELADGVCTMSAAGKETVEMGSPTVGSQISVKSPILQEGNQIGGSCSDSFSASPAVRKTSEDERSKTSLCRQRWRRASGTKLSNTSFTSLRGLQHVPSATSVEGSGCELAGRVCTLSAARKEKSVVNLHSNSLTEVLWMGGQTSGGSARSSGSAPSWAAELSFKTPASKKGKKKNKKTKDRKAKVGGKDDGKTRRKTKTKIGSLLEVDCPPRCEISSLTASKTPMDGDMAEKSTTATNRPRSEPNAPIDAKDRMPLSVNGQPFYCSNQFPEKPDQDQQKGDHPAKEPRVRVQTISDGIIDFVSVAAGLFPQNRPTTDSTQENSYQYDQRRQIVSNACDQVSRFSQMWKY